MNVRALPLFVESRALWFTESQALLNVFVRTFCQSLFTKVVSEITEFLLVYFGGEYCLWEASILISQLLFLLKLPDSFIGQSFNLFLFFFVFEGRVANTNRWNHTRSLFLVGNIVEVIYCS